MKNTIFYYLSVLMLFTIGCSTSNKSGVKQHQEKNYKIALTNLKKGKSIKKNQKLLINAIKHKDFINIKDKFEKIGTLLLMNLKQLVRLDMKIHTNDMMNYTRI